MYNIIDPEFSNFRNKIGHFVLAYDRSTFRNKIRKFRNGWRVCKLNIYKNGANKFGRKTGFKIENEIEDQDQSKN